MSLRKSETGSDADFKVELELIGLPSLVSEAMSL
jgi:hypothetical protein